MTKCHQLQGDEVPLTSDQGLCPCTPLGPPPQTPLHNLASH